MAHVVQEQKKMAGFTLLEMLVTITVMVVLMTVTTINFRSSEKNELLRLSARRIGDALSQIENYALAGTQAAYQSVKSYGVHIDSTQQQPLLIFADINTSTPDGTPFVGRWDGVVADAQGKKDIQIGEAQSVDASKKNALLLDSITVVYALKSGAAVSAGCDKDGGGACVKDTSGNFLKKVTTVDIAAELPTARVLVSGGSDFPSDVSGILVKQVIFDVKQQNTDHHKLVTISTLSGRIDVQY